MSKISASLVKELREKTGVGMMDCKKALTQTEGDFNEAVKFLREKGLSSAVKKSDREAKEGSIFIATLPNLKNSIILSLNCETDFVASNDDFKSFGQQLAQSCIDNKIETIESLESLTIDGSSFKNAIAELVLKLGENIHVGQLSAITTSGSIYSYLQNTTSS